jgi:two-component system sensor histidine kinase QseC
MTSISIKRFLLLNLLISVTIASSLTIIGSYLLDNIDIQKQLDSQLQQSAEMINTILIQTDTKQQSITQALNKNQIIAQSNFQFQILDSAGKLLSHSSEIFSIPIEKLPQGLSTQKVNQRIWRVYTKYNDKQKTIFSMGEQYNLRAQLEHRLSWDNLSAILWTYPLLALFILLIINRNLNTFKKISLSLANRSTSNFEAIDVKNIPNEIKPLTEELNKLFLRLQYSFERNKRFASDAAHELRTPLAALKTQTQVALLSVTNEKERKAALSKILQGVDRCIHIVQQLLILSRLSQETISEDFLPLNLYKILSDILADLVPAALEKNIDLALLESDQQAFIYGNETTLGILVRNLIDNAIRYTPKSGTVEAQIIRNEDQIILRVADNGPGIQPEMRKRVFERFYRILGTKTQGSGLGLAIVKQISDLHHALIKLGTNPTTGQGLEVEIIFSAY